MSMQLKKNTENNNLYSMKDNEKRKLDFEFFKNFESVHTIKSYRNDINTFFSFTSELLPNITDFYHIERVHIVAYKNWLKDIKEYAPKTINRKLSSISSYFDFLVEKGLMEFNSCSNIKRPKQSIINPTNDLSDEQIEKLFSEIDTSTKSGPLHKAIIFLLFSTGIRKSELINLKRKHYKKINDHYIIEVRAKGGKQLVKALHPMCVEVLDDYLRWMESKGRPVSSDDWVFQPTENPSDPSTIVKSLNPKSIDYILKKYAKKAGIFQKISPHSARASYIGSALEHGEDLFRVSQDVGHSSVKTTQDYSKRRQKIEQSPAYNLVYLNKKDDSSDNNQ